MVEIENCFSQLSILTIENYCILQPDLDPLNDKSVAQKEKQHCFTMESEVACLVINWNLENFRDLPKEVDEAWRI